MKVTAYSAGAEGTSPKWVKAFAAGAGCASQTGGPLRDGAVAMFGSPHLEPMLFQAIAEGRTWFYGDHAFFGRGQYYRCGRNEYQFDGLSGDDDPARFRRFGIPIKEWRKSGSHILLCPNSESFLHRYGSPDWVKDVSAVLRGYTDRKIKVRWKRDADRRPIAVDLADAWAVVTFTSVAGVDAILAGVPAFATRACAALSLGSCDLSMIETPTMPNGREAWAARLANRQWNLDEMARGDLWRAIGER